MFNQKSSLGILLAFSCSSVFAATQVTSTFQVTANVPSACIIVNTNPLNFGNYNSTTATAAQTTFKVACTKNLAYKIGMSNGLYGDATQRKMRNTTETNYFLNYNIYQDNNFTQAWGPVTGANVYSGNGSGEEQTITIYGQLPAAGGQSSGLPFNGSYNDTITITLEY